MTQQPYGQQMYGQAPQQPLGPKPSALDVLGGVGKAAPPALKKGPKHRAAGEYAGGRIVAFDSIPETEAGRTMPDGTYAPGAVKRFPSGDVIWTLYVDVQTSERDPMREHDDGVRRIYLSGAGKKAQYVSSLKAVQEAIAATGKAYLELGGDLWIAWTHEVPTQASPAISWTSKYAPPAAALAAAVLATADPQQQYAAPTPQPQYAPPAPVPAGYGQPAPQPQYGQPQGYPQAAAPAQHMTPEQVAALGQLGAAPVQGGAPF